ncbi:MAG TPA: ParB N-terminal domain-containing protein [Leptolyngbyaceae cyanobacterium]
MVKPRFQDLIALNDTPLEDLDYLPRANGQPTVEGLPEGVRFISAVPAEKIRKGRFQFRMHFDPEKIKALAEVFQKRGFIGFLLVEEGSNGEFLLIGGERRWLASQEAKIERLPCMVVEGLSDLEVAILGLEDNESHEPLSGIEHTKGVLTILRLAIFPGEPDSPETEKKVISLVNGMIYDLKQWQRQNPGKPEPESAIFTQRIGADKVLEVFNDLPLIKWQTFAKKRLALLNLPDDLREAVLSNSLASAKALMLAKVEDEEVRSQLTEMAADLSKDALKEKIKELTPQPEQDGLTTIAGTIQKKLKTVSSLSESKRKRVQTLLEELELLLS